MNSQPRPETILAYLLQRGWKQTEDKPETVWALCPPEGRGPTVVIPRLDTYGDYSLRVRQAILDIVEKSRKSPQEIERDLALATFHRLRANYAPESSAEPGPTPYAQAAIITALSDLLKTAAVEHRERSRGPARYDAWHINPIQPHAAEIAFQETAENHQHRLADTLAQLLEDTATYVRKPVEAGPVAARFQERTANLIAHTNGAGATVTLTHAVHHPAIPHERTYHFNWQDQLPLLDIAPNYKAATK